MIAQNSEEVAHLTDSQNLIFDRIIIEKIESKKSKSQIVDEDSQQIMEQERGKDKIFDESNIETNLQGREYRKKSRNLTNNYITYLLRQVGIDRQRDTISNLAFLLQQSKFNNDIWKKIGGFIKQKQNNIENEQKVKKLKEIYQTLKTIRQNPSKFKILGLTMRQNSKKLIGLLLKLKMLLKKNLLSLKFIKAHLPQSQNWILKYKQNKGYSLNGSQLKTDYEIIKEIILNTENLKLSDYDHQDNTDRMNQNSQKLNNFIQEWGIILTKVQQIENSVLSLYFLELFSRIFSIQFSCESNQSKISFKSNKNFATYEELIKNMKQFFDSTQFKLKIILWGEQLISQKEEYKKNKDPINQNQNNLQITKKKNNPRKNNLKQSVPASLFSHKNLIKQEFSSVLKEFVFYKHRRSPTDWIVRQKIQKCQKYFDLNLIPEHQILHVISQQLRDLILSKIFVIPEMKNLYSNVYQILKGQQQNKNLFNIENTDSEQICEKLNEDKDKFIKSPGLNVQENHQSSEQDDLEC